VITVTALDKLPKCSYTLIALMASFTLPHLWTNVDAASIWSTPLCPLEEVVPVFVFFFKRELRRRVTHAFFIASP
jgi:hypothetical protein